MDATSEPPAGPVEPDAAAIGLFAETVFGYTEDWAAVRVLAEKGGPAVRPRTPFHRADADLARKLLQEAAAAAEAGAALFIVPGVVAQPGQATAADVTATQVVLVDLDEGDIAGKRAHLVRHLGEPTLEVASGGVTEDGQDRLHLYWKLSEPAQGPELAQVCELRGEIARKVGGDPSFRSAHQPIRVAGSVYGKHGVRRPVRIVAARRLEHHLVELVESVDRMPSLFEKVDGAEAGHRSADRIPLDDLWRLNVRENGVDGVTRFEALSRVIGYWVGLVRRRTATQEQAWNEIVSYNEARIDPPWPLDRLRDEVQRLQRLDAERHADNPVPPEFTEDALAARFTAEHGDDWRYVNGWCQWLEWDGARWRREITLKVNDRARHICRAAAAGCGDKKLRGKLASAATVSAVERLARADRTHAAGIDEWDADPWRLNTPGGLVDLKSGSILPHDRSQLITKITTATPKGCCPLWRAFLAEVTGGDEALQRYLQRVVGYCLTGVTGEHALFFLHGAGANGKSVFLNTISTILGDYAAVAPMDLLMAATGERHPTDLAGLRGARLVTATETEQGRRWAESRLKILTGGDKITARFMRQDFFDYTPQFKLLLAGNHKPAIRNLDEAMRRRLHLIPFTVTIPPERRDKRLPEKLLAEGGGVLAWALEGCREWLRVGLAPPRAVVDATAEYFEAEDAVGRWLEDACERAPHLVETTSNLFSSWKAWAEAAGEHVGTMKSFAANLVGRGFEQRRSRRSRGFRGIQLRQGGGGAAELEV